MVLSDLSIPEKSTVTLFWASRGESRSIGGPPLEFNASRNFLTPPTT